MNVDWQTFVTLAIGVAAAAYLAHRWWPTLSGLFHSTRAGMDAGQGKDASAGACGTATPTAPGASPCGSGCGQCGSAATRPKDHSVHWIKQRS